MRTLTRYLCWLLAIKWTPRHEKKKLILRQYIVKMVSHQCHVSYCSRKLRGTCKKKPTIWGQTGGIGRGFRWVAGVQWQVHVQLDFRGLKMFYFLPSQVRILFSYLTLIYKQYFFSSLCPLSHLVVRSWIPISHLYPFVWFGKSTEHK